MRKWGWRPSGKSPCALTAYALELHDAWLAPAGVRLATPRDPEQRGSHITIDHPAFREVTAALWDKDVIPDFRAPAGIRIGLSPLSTGFAELHRGMAAVRDLLPGTDGMGSGERLLRRPPRRFDKIATRPVN